MVAQQVADLPISVIARGQAWLRSRKGELAKFGSIGLLAFFVDLGVFNLLLIGFRWSPTVATVVSVTVATLFSWVGNRYWTFAAQKTTARGRELAGFILANLVGMAIGVACVYLSHYVLGFTSPLADNIAKNVVGLGLGTVFRYFAYRRWVFIGGN